MIFVQMIECREETGVSLTDRMCGDFRRSVRFRVSQPHREKNLRLIHAISRTQLLYVSVGKRSTRHVDVMILGVQKSSELFFVKFNLYYYVIVRKWLAA